jgi:hypothetical protein
MSTEINQTTEDSEVLTEEEQKQLESRRRLWGNPNLTNKKVKYIREESKVAEPAKCVLDPELIKQGIWDSKLHSIELLSPTNAISNNKENLQKTIKHDRSEFTANIQVTCSNDCAYCYSAVMAVERGFINNRVKWANDYLKKEVPSFNKKYNHVVHYLLST